ncbi:MULTISPECIES: metallophosphoesterase [unclassified Enterococcus]|uniref:metallophosphoesterase n=1 Tax=unclassified Enterococcus TaxID=2608891 RepID=UPI0015554A7F|nr:MULTISPECIES: metallophosphoesterase [unclassified Enterococcus]MBS7576772.1 metallophosphoesterase [Enterococcus sp. MMGLQ5-2]MBS7583741.1 metallophosphoesterase [Enterococcus sp. MMGLQ5-1]NPD11602.1 metallophosphoesterase [Enterococcus sp. MMGLQ5-1]NPD36609.1 metallophosphoesterase [Enterococcus sp. MMGLQ5-2]
MFVVMSDSHGDRDIVEEIKAKYINSATAIFHCGDSELPANDQIWQGITVVTGNCDYDAAYQEVSVRNVEGHRILVTHGHLYSVNYGLSRLSLLAQEHDCDIALFGHTHIATVEKVNNELCINPGSVRQPRGYPFVPTYAIVAFLNQTVTINFLNREHQILEDMTKVIEL